jgi:hypothetical protein
MTQEQTNERLIAAFQGFAEQQQAFNQQLTSAVLDLQGIAKRQEAFNQSFNQRLDSIDQHLIGIDQHLVGVDQELKGLHTKVDGLEERMDTQFKAVRKEFKKEIEGLKSLTGRYSTKLGKFYERLILPNILDKFEKIGYHFDTVDINMEFFEEGKKNRLAEIDIVLENGTQVLLVETKGSLRNSFVNEHLARIQLLRDKGYFPGKAIYGALAAPFIDIKPCKYAQAHGLFVLCQPDAFPVKIEEFMEGYAPQSW